MRAVIPVAGFGTRLKPHTLSVPKVLLNVGGKPMLGHIIDKLLEVNINKATFIIGHLGEQIEEYVKKEYPKLRSDFVIQEEMLGLGHAIYTAVPTFDDDKIFIILGDTIFDVDLTHVLKEDISALGVKEIDDPRRFGVAVIKDGYVEKLVEKPKEPVSNLAIVGLYYITNPKLLAESLKKLMDENIKTRGEFQLTDALQIMVDRGEKMKVFDVQGWYDCGKPETLLSTNKFLLSQKSTKRDIGNVVINHPVFIAENAVIENSVIGPDTTIAENCRIVDSVIKNSIVGANSTVERSMLDSSIIGSNAIIKGNYKRMNAGDSSEIEFY